MGGEGAGWEDFAGFAVILKLLGVEILQAMSLMDKLQHVVESQVRFGSFNVRGTWGVEGAGIGKALHSNYERNWSYRRTLTGYVTHG